MRNRIPIIAFLSFLGLVDTLYLSFAKRSGPVPCHVTRGCNDVLNSVYSEVAGIPLQWFGLVFYFLVLGCAIFEWFGTSGSLKRAYGPIVAAFLLSAFLTGIQVFILRAYCEYCLASAGIVTGIFAVATLGGKKPSSRDSLRKRKK